eukprot:CAMPEP_0201576460 /NCGR_PEP_ID=MMETSP0190_2-20130828/22315_1 /ASSEMBLY_ACC=CAM_ASM_000263 /TAXON_ID=37353 /ORGANISM="Rosalina sp." /LENGTH=80 /DNA_ID=CAMNT_0048007361 /DNA_START=27 /DNA_END=266 /DNA_ORIENTATION=+
MIKITILALFMALSNAEKTESGASRLLLQAAAPLAPPAPPAPPAQGQPQPQVQPTPAQGIPRQQPQQPAYNPYGAQNPLC